MKGRSALLILALIVLTGCTSQGANDDQFRHYFELPEFGQITPDSARSALLKRFPLGTPANEISTVLERRGIGKDSLNRYYPLDERGAIVCQIYRGSKNLVGERFIVTFLFDRAKKLKDIEVKQALTGM